MTVSREDSEIRVWSVRYINDNEYRSDEHKDLVVIQCEPADNDGNYMVEVYKRNAAKLANESMKNAIDSTLCRKEMGHFAAE